MTLDNWVKIEGVLKLQKPKNAKNFRGFIRGTKPRKLFGKKVFFGNPG